jgi:predicted metal-dependent peptidase
MNPFGKIKKDEEFELVSYYLRHVKNSFSNLGRIVDTITVREPYENESVKTMAVSPSASGGTWLIFNKKFVLENHNFFISKVKNAPVKYHYIYNVLSHEIMHICLNHFERMKAGKFNPRLWNIATDTIINYQFDWTVCKRIILNEEAWPYKKNRLNKIFFLKNPFKDNCEEFGNGMTPLMRSSSKVFDLISPASCWVAVIDKCKYLVKEKLKESYDGVKITDKDIPLDDDAKHRIRSSKKSPLDYISEYEICVNKDSAFSNISGFQSSFRFAEDYKSIYTKSNKIYADIVEWISFYQIDKNSTARSWYDAYKELYNLLEEFEKSLEFFVKPTKSVISDSNDKYDKMPIPTFGGMGSSGESTREMAEEIFDSTGLDDGVDEQNASNPYHWADYDLSGTASSSKEFKSKSGSSISKNSKRSKKQGTKAGKGIGASDLLIISQIQQSYSIEWHSLLDSIVSSTMKPRYESTIFRPNRRWGMKMPGKRVEWEGAVNIAIDTSGSVIQSDIDEFFLSLKDAAKKNKNLEFNIILFHSIVYKEYLNFNIKNDKIEIQCGGTDFSGPLKRLEELNKKNYGICIMFTDGMARVPNKSEFDNKFVKSLHWVFWVGFSQLGGRINSYFGNGKNIFLR